MKKNLLVTVAVTAVIAGLMSGCSMTGSQPQNSTGIPTVMSDSRMADCSLPTVEGDRGPIRPSLYVVGTFPQSQWIHEDGHKMSYKGDGIYQVVSQEKKGNISLQFATMSWVPQFTVSGLKLPAGVEKKLKRGGFAKDTVASFPEDGKYVWSIKFSEDKKPVTALIARCSK